MFTTAEKQELLFTSQNLSKNLSDSKEFILITKALLNYLEKMDPVAVRTLIPDLSIDFDTDKDRAKEILRKIFGHIFWIASEDQQFTRQYTTGQMAKYFGVSVQTINTWIKDGRILGVEKPERNKQARIPETAIYVSTIGERIPITEIVEMYNKENAEREGMSLQGEPTYAQKLAQLSTEIEYFEKKYGGSLEETLGLKVDRSVEEDRDAGEWAYLMRKVREL
ncbi:helix-turn-helix domain-containing protein [Brevibacillus centrosporus]|uniref:helix-turn-helix domain-containing protein n=1 Tax=Brevibacillus centrosporus TaxID=54910 RepID=UPI0027D95BE3|nr:helix-turn-helix domain-containing protein [Brevibacillus centrosporus]